VTTNVFFNNFESYAEQTLIEDLIIESIRMYGHDLYYCPRKIESKDLVFNEDVLSTYNTAYLIEMYIKNVEGFEGEGDFLSKFNIQIRDEITFTLSQRVYNDSIGAEEVNTRPREGDLIYFPLTQKVYVIKFVEHEAVFYQLGKLQTYDLRCELFEYSNEDLNTGVPMIDELEELYSTNVGIGNNADTYANGDIIINPDTGRANNISSSYNMSNDPFADNDIYDALDTFIDFTEIDPFSEGNI
jgi:hypothetical protein